MRVLTKAQRGLLKQLAQEAANGDAWTEVFKREARSARALAERGLIELDEWAGGQLVARLVTASTPAPPSS